MPCQMLSTLVVLATEVAAEWSLHYYTQKRSPYHVLMHILHVSFQLIRLGEGGITFGALQFPIRVSALQSQLSRGRAHGPLCPGKDPKVPFHYI